MTKIGHDSGHKCQTRLWNPRIASVVHDDHPWDGPAAGDKPRTLAKNPKIPGLVNIQKAIENGPFIVELSIENGDFP